MLKPETAGGGQHRSPLPIAGRRSVELGPEPYLRVCLTCSAIGAGDGVQPSSDMGNQTARRDRLGDGRGSA